jgi:hypothetical protein
MPDHFEIEKRNEIVAQDSGLSKVPEDRRGPDALMDLDDLRRFRVAFVRIGESAPEEESAADRQQDREDQNRAERLKIFPAASARRW